MLNAIKEALIRRRAALHALPLDRFAVRVARTAREYEEAFALVNAAYVYTGMQTRPSPFGLRIVAQHPLRESTVIVAYDGQQLVATMTIIQDSNIGLPVDKVAPDAVAALRASGARMVEYAALAVVKRYARSGVTQLMNMAAYNYAYNYLQANYIVMSVAPRAVPLYRAIFGFREIDAAHGHPTLALPVASLALDMVAAQSFVRTHYPKPMSDGVVPLEHFLGTPPACITLPPQELRGDALMRWKLPREVFQDLFVRRSNHIATLTEDVLEQLRGQRSRDTLMQQDGPLVGEHEAREALDQSVEAIGMTNKA